MASEIYERAAKDSDNYWERNHVIRHGTHAAGEQQQHDHVVRIYIPYNGRDPLPEGAELGSPGDVSEEPGDDE